MWPGLTSARSSVCGTAALGFDVRQLKLWLGKLGALASVFGVTLGRNMT
jgi:hypothetical protein